MGINVIVRSRTEPDAIIVKTVSGAYSGTFYGKNSRDRIYNFFGITYLQCAQLPTGITFTVPEHRWEKFAKWLY